MKKINFYIKCLVLLLLLFKITACNIAAGSYPYAELYHINVNENDLVKAIINFKKQYPEYNVPSQTQLEDGREDDKDLWYHIYFYFPRENQIIYAWTRPGNKGETTFAFVSVNEGLNLGNWKDVNKDFKSSDNSLQKEKFEKRILNVIKSKFLKKVQF